MENIYKKLDLTSNEISIKRVKEILTKWADNIPGHRLNDFGNNITINSIQVLPSHKLEFQTQYEERSVSKKVEPYITQKILELKFTEINQVAPWKFQLNEIEPFQNKLINYDVAGSQVVSICSTCSGEGNITCPTCIGKGIETCYSCNGRGLMSCYSCSGSGKTPCTSCGGSGRESERSCGSCSGNGYKYDQLSKRNIQCSSCGGRGKIRGGSCRSCGGTGKTSCYSCNGTGEKRCTTCNGKGNITCRTCNGNKIVTCNSCEGHKKVVSSFVINQNFTTKKDVEIQHNTEIAKKYPYFKIESKDYVENIAFEKSDNYLSENLFEQNDYIESLYKKQRQNALEKNEATQIITQTIKINQIEVVAVDYLFNNKEYQLLIYGAYDKVYAPLSPITEIRDALYFEAETLHKSNKNSEALEKLDRAIGMNEDERVKYLDILREKVIHKLNQYYKYGALLGTTIGAYLFFTITLFFLEKPRFFISSLNDDYLKAEWMQSILPITVGILFLILIKNIYKSSSNFLIKYCSVKIRGNNSLILAGTFVSSFFVFLMWIIVMLGNAIGISIPFSIIGYYLVQLFHFIISFL